MIAPKKILVLRFSSIGDLVLITPTLRCISNTFPTAELHLLCKPQFASVLANNPNINSILPFEHNLSKQISILKSTNYDLVLDWQSNLKSRWMCLRLNKKTLRFNKLNFKKWIAVRFKTLEILPQLHIVDRYFEALKPLAVYYDNKGLDFFLNPDSWVSVKDEFQIQNSFVVIVVGASYYTKQIPHNKLIEFIELITWPVVLIGGSKDIPIMQLLQDRYPNRVYFKPHLTLHQSASILQQASWVVTSDTGMMHIAAALNKPIVSVWGNTIPEFGMKPFNPHMDNIYLEVKHLECRPCSKLGFHACPCRHFNCMNTISLNALRGLPFTQQ